MLNRRQFLARAGGALLALGAGAPRLAGMQDSRQLTLCLLGDVMTGRGIDQVLGHSNPPRIYEPYARSARVYVELAEKANGPIPAPVAPGYLWGDALGELERVRPALRIANLETAVTCSGEPWPDKGIHYRMHPLNVDCLTRAGIDCCTLANNHVLDWGYAGLTETLDALAAAGIATAGAGSDLERASAPAIFDAGPGGRVLVFACGAASSGIPRSWAAGRDRAGVYLLADLADAGLASLGASIGRERRTGDLVVVSIHWGGNWGYAVTRAERRFAHRLIEEAGVDLVFGHSSHHPRPLEVHRDRLVLYGCGDFLNDYEGISGREEYRSDLVLMYFATLDAGGGGLVGLTMTPFQLRRFQPRAAGAEQAEWLAATLDRESRGLGTRIELDPAGRLRLAR